MENQSKVLDVDWSFTKFRCCDKHAASDSLAAFAAGKKEPSMQSKRKCYFFGRNSNLNDAFRSLHTVENYLKKQESSNVSEPPSLPVVSELMAKTFAEIIEQKGNRMFDDSQKISELGEVLTKKYWRPVFRAYANRMIAAITKTVAPPKKDQVSAKLTPETKSNWVGLFKEYLSKGKTAGTLDSEALRVARTVDQIFTSRELCHVMQSKWPRLVKDLQEMLEEILDLVDYFSTENLASLPAEKRLDPLSLNENLVLLCFAVCIKDRYDIFVLRSKPADAPAPGPLEADNQAEPTQPSQGARAAIAALQDQLLASKVTTQAGQRTALVKTFLESFPAAADRLLWVQTILKNKALMTAVGQMRVHGSFLMPGLISVRLSNIEATLDAGYTQLLAKLETKQSAFSNYLGLKLSRYADDAFTPKSADTLSTHVACVVGLLRAAAETRVCDKMVVEIMSDLKAVGKVGFVVLSFVFPHLLGTDSKVDIEKLRESCVGAALKKGPVKGKSVCEGINRVTKLELYYLIEVDPVRILPNLDFLDCWLLVASKFGTLRDDLLGLLHSKYSFNSLTVTKPLSLRKAMVEFIATNGSSLFPGSKWNTPEQLEPEIFVLQELDRVYNIGFSYSQKPSLKPSQSLADDMHESIKDKCCQIDRLTHELGLEMSLWGSLSCWDSFGPEEHDLFEGLEHRINRLKQTVEAAGILRMKDTLDSGERITSSSPKSSRKNVKRLSKLLVSNK